LTELEKQRRQTSEGRRRSVFVGIFSILPVLVVAGVLAPDLVRVTAVEEEPTDSVPVQISSRISHYAHQPLLLPNDFSGEFIPEVFDLEHLFSRVEYTRDPTVRDHTRFSNPPSQFGDVDPLNGVDQPSRQIVFQNPAPMRAATDSALPPTAGDLALPGGPPANGAGQGLEDHRWLRSDLSEQVAIPEPSTGLLVGMGLVLLGVIRGSGRARRA